MSVVWRGALRVALGAVLVAVVSVGAPTVIPVRGATPGFTPLTPTWTGVPNYTNENVLHTHWSVDDAAAHARRFDVIVAWTRDYEGDVAAMRAANPDLMLFAYMNGSAVGRKYADTFPDDWYLRDASGAKVRSKAYGNYMMDPADPGWIANRVATCQEDLATSDFNGCYLDVLGVSPTRAAYVTGVPIDPRTGQPWTAADWLAATSSLATAVKSGVTPAPVLGNGLGNGPLYFNATAPTSQLLDGIDAGMAESWLRHARDAIGNYPSIRQWTESIEMLRTSEKPVFALTKVWVSAAITEKRAWHRFALASFLLANPGGDYFDYSWAPQGLVTDDPFIRATKIGAPVGTYALRSGVYQRTYSNGRVLVNPSFDTFTIALGGNYVRLDGVTVNSVTLGPHGAAILRLP